MNNNPSDISSYLIKLVEANDGNTAGTTGLVSGRLGICFLYYLYSATLKNKDSAIYLRKGQRLFNTVFKQIESLEIEVTFSQGIEGFGWLVEWLVQNKLVKSNTDKFLEDIDDVVFQIAANVSMDDISLGTGITGHLFYFISRYRGIGSFSDRYRIIYIEDTLVLLSDELIERIFSKLKNCNPLSSKKAAKQLVDLALLKDIANGLYGLVQLWQDNLNTNNIQGALSEFVQITEENICSYLQNETLKEDEKGIVLSVLNILVYVNRSFTRNGTSFNRMKNCFDNVLGIWIKNTYPTHQQSLLNIVILRTLGTFYKYAKEKRYLAEKKFFYDKVMHNFSSFPPAQSDFYLNGKVGLMLLLLQNESTNGRVLGDAEYLIF